MTEGIVSEPVGGLELVDKFDAAEWLRQRQQEIELELDEEERRFECDPDYRRAVEEKQKEELRLVMQEWVSGIGKRAREIEAENRILDFDPKQGGAYYSRLYHVFDIDTFDHDEESPLGPMRYTDRVYNNERKCMMSEGVNIFSLKIASSDVGFPLHVYGTVVARDSIDPRCVYLFKRDKDHCQLINSEHESLILTGPKRGLALISDTYLETNLKIKGHQGQEDRELSKGVLTIQGMARRGLLEKCKLETCSLATRLSTVDVMYAVVKSAVEATIAIEVLEGDFYGEITAHTTSIENNLVLYDSKSAGEMTHDGGRVIQLLRSVVCVYLKEMLYLNFSWQGRDSFDDNDITGCRRDCLLFTPSVNGWAEDEITLGRTRIRLKVVWSLVDY